MEDRKSTKKKVKILWGLIIVAFCLIEFPGIFFINRIEPMILGFPFLYGFTLIIWGILCILMFIGYKLKWGTNETETSETQKTGRQKERK